MIRSDPKVVGGCRLIDLQLSILAQFLCPLQREKEVAWSKSVIIQRAYARR
jgi:hypothetical protein